MTRALKAATAILAAVWLLAVVPAEAKDKVKVAFIGPLTGGDSANGLGGRNSADLRSTAQRRPESQVRVRTGGAR